MTFYLPDKSGDASKGAKKFEYWDTLHQAAMPNSYYMQFTFTSGLVFDLLDYIIEIEGKVIHVDDQGEATPIGRVLVYKFDIDAAMEQKLRLRWDIFEHSPELQSIYNGLFNPPSDEYRDDLKQVVGDWISNGLGLLVIYSVEVDADHRDRGIEMCAIARSVRQLYHGCTIVGIRSPDESGPIAEGAVSLGFHPLSSGEFMVLSTLDDNPKVEELIEMRWGSDHPDLWRWWGSASHYPFRRE